MAVSNRWDYAEQRLFAGSPFNLWLTTALLYALLVGVYAAAAGLSRQPWIIHGPAGLALAPIARLALVLSLLVCVILAQQRASRLKEEIDAPAFARALRPGSEAAWSTAFSRPRLRVFTAVGVALGVAASVALIPGGSNPAPAPLAAWFAMIAIILAVLFMRGLELTGAAARQTRQVIHDHLQIDLLNIERLYPWGRAAARTAMVWFTVSATALLLFASNGFTLYTVATLLGCAAIGGWVFVGTLTQVHHRIRTVKAAELERLRAEINTLVQRSGDDAAAAQKLTGLLAYEARIAAAPEWPFDQTIVVRLGVSSLILTVPWFGQAVAGVVVEHMGKVLH